MSEFETAAGLRIKATKKMRLDFIYKMRHNHYQQQQKLMFYVFIVLYLLLFDTTLSNENSNKCHLDRNTSTLICTDLIYHTILNNTNVPWNSNDNSQEFTSSSASKTWTDEDLQRINTIKIYSSEIPKLDLSIFNNFKFNRLEYLEISNCKIEVLIGKLPNSIKILNLTNNNLFHLSSDILIKNEFGFSESKLELIDLKNNLLITLPAELFLLPIQLKQVGLAGNNFTCTWVRNDLYKWWSSKQQNPINNETQQQNPINNDNETQELQQQLLLLYENETFCATNEIAFGEIPFLIALKVKRHAVEECERTICSCDIRGYFINKKPNRKFPLVYQSNTINATVTLKLDCSNMGLVELPQITPFATALSVQHNQITNIQPLLNDENYKNVIGIDLSFNQLENIEFLLEPKIIEHYQFILLNGNRIQQIPLHIMNEIFAQHRTHLMTLHLGENIIHCDCYTKSRLKPLLIKNEKVIDDWRNITCKDINKQLINLKWEDVCDINTDSNTAKQIDIVLYSLVAFEIILIILIIGKVWFDSKKYHETGTLPSFSHWIPRLPCDFMLEGLKETHSHHHNNHSHSHSSHHQHHSSLSSHQGSTTNNTNSTNTTGNNRRFNGGQGLRRESNLSSHQHEQKQLMPINA